LSQKSAWLATGGLRLYYVVTFFLGMTFALYYTYTRALISIEYEEKYGFVTLLVAMESIPSLFSVILGFFSDRIGRRKMLLMGVITGFFLGTMGFVDIKYFPLIALPLFFSLTTYQATVYGIILHSVEGVGKPFSIFGLAGSIGWATGGLLPGVLHNHGGSVFVFVFAGTIISISSIIAFMVYPKTLTFTSPSIKDLFKGIRNVSILFIAMLVGSAGIGIYISSVGVKLYEEVGNILVYGMLFSTLTGITGAMVRPLAGALVDRFTPQFVLFTVFISYGILSFLMPFFSGIIFIILWLLPVYPFYETSGYTTFSRRLPPSLQATSAGIVGTSTSLSGFINIFSSKIIGSGGFGLAMSVSLALLFISSLIILFYLRFKLK